METFIYYCISADGSKMNFFSKAVLDTGMTVTNENGIPFTIVDMIIHKYPSVREDALSRIY